MQKTNLCESLTLTALNPYQPDKILTSPNSKHFGQAETYNINFAGNKLTLSQTTNFRLFQTEIWRRKFQI